jgi:NADH-quinone oxidoreductase subunit C
MLLSTTPAALESISNVFPSALWAEREVYDMLGIVFLGHVDLRRLLTDYSFKGFPLLKQFSVMGYKSKAYSTVGKNIMTIDLLK